MRSTGASEQAMRFGERFEGWATDFRELGPVDVVGWVAAFAANIIQGEALVNGTPDVISLDNYDFNEADLGAPRRSGRSEATRPMATMFSHRFVRKEPTPDGSRFVVVADFAKCNACRNEVLAHAEIAYDLDARGTFSGFEAAERPVGAAPPIERPPASSRPGEPRAATADFIRWLSERPCAESALPRMADCSRTTKRLPGLSIHRYTATIYPLSPSGRYSIVVVHTANGNSSAHLIDLEERKARSVHIPTNRVSQMGVLVRGRALRASGERTSVEPRISPRSNGCRRCRLARMNRSYPTARFASPSMDRSSTRGRCWPRTAAPTYSAGWGQGVYRSNWRNAAGQTTAMGPRFQRT